ncbi:hypothetical protein [Nitriliruptor alkaliphilus]|uniref:hypothetical protein n=1 Tax=Nitriliruptor alkaliphilus TaxID=427918 RepID=UPI000696DF00|nr:hypothetical protein [Nitriliruptor alkaliphilus]
MNAADGSFDGASEPVSATVTTETAGVAEVCVTAIDAAGQQSAPGCVALAIYDPSGGFAVGNGAVHSPAGADRHAAAEGPARFTFVPRHVRDGADATRYELEPQVLTGGHIRIGR